MEALQNKSAKDIGGGGENPITHAIRSIANAYKHMTDPHSTQDGSLAGSPEDDARKFQEQKEAFEHINGSIARKSVFNADSGLMKLERLRVFDVNGLVGKSHRNAVTGQCYLKEVESWRDFSLVDLWTRESIKAMPDEHVLDTHLYKARPLNMRTWRFHSKYAAAQAKFNVANSEAFLLEALVERCADTSNALGLWSPAMVYAPLLPFTLLCGDYPVFWFAAFCCFQCLLISVAANEHTLYFWARPIMLPARLLFLFFLLSRIQGSSIQLCGYALTIFGVLLDLIMGDAVWLNSGRYYCGYEVLRILPNQLFVCKPASTLPGMLNHNAAKRIPIPEKVTGLKDPGDGSIKLIVNIQGLLVEVIPVNEDDQESFKEEHAVHASDPRLGNTKFVGLDVFQETYKSVADLDRAKEKYRPSVAISNLRENAHNMRMPTPDAVKAPLASRQTLWTVEDMA
jgi:hypothetical protein